MITDFESRELEELENMVRSQGYRVYLRNLVSKRRTLLVERSHTSLKKYKDRDAGEQLAKAEELSHIHKMVRQRIDDLREKQKGEE